MFDDPMQQALHGQNSETAMRLARAAELAGIVVALLQGLKVGGFPDDIAIEMARDYFDALIDCGPPEVDEDD